MLLFSHATSFLLLGQSFEVIPKDKDFTYYGDLDYMDIEAKIYNNSTNPADSVFVWERTTKAPSSWQFTLCDTENCWLPSIEKNTFTLKKGENWIFNVAMYPGGVAGKGEATVVVYPLGKKELSKTYVYRGIAIDPLGNTKGEGALSFDLFPNPATTQLQINFKSSLEGVKYSITNELGVSSELAELPLTNNLKTINIHHLPNGVYLLNLYVKNMGVIQKKFTKSF